MAIGWLTNMAEANTYYSTRYGGTGWILFGEDNKTALLTTAYNRIRFNKNYSIPSSPTSTQLEKLKMAQEELAWHYYIHLVDEDRRKGLQAQGVIEADVVGETYDSEKLYDLPLPPFVKHLLSEFSSGKFIGLANVGRDEDEDAKGTTQTY